MVNAAMLLLRVTLGGLLAGHGAQKLFGWFGGPGLQGTRGWLQSLGYPPEQPWAEASATAELGGGVLTALGFLGPIGPALTTGAMATATVKVHWGKPIWVTSGGAELPVTNMAIAGALMLAGPGDWSLDGLLGIRVPRWVAIPAALASAAGVAYGVWQSKQALQAQQQAQPEMPEGETPEQQGTGRPQSATA
jgi:putative oxidoreductase